MSHTVVHLVRHGEVYNPEGILYGRLPGYGLSDWGRRQAELATDALAGHDVAHLVTSPLLRAQQTAQPLAQKCGLPAGTDDALIESGNSFEGERVSVGDGVWRAPRHWPKLRNPLRPSWGEPYLHIAHRVLGAVHRARQHAEGREAVCVSHQLPVWTVRRFLEGKRLWHDPRRRECGLASITSLVFDDAALVDLVYSEPAGASDPKQAGA